MDGVENKKYKDNFEYWIIIIKKILKIIIKLDKKGKNNNNKSKY